MRSWSFSFLTLLLSLLAATLWVGTIVYHKVYDSNSDDDIEELENVVLQKLYQGTMKSEWRNITLTRQEEREITKEREKKEAEIWLTHLLVPTNFDETKPNLILMHGYGATSALTWRVTIPGLVDKFNVFAIDMPGFGRTPAPQSLLSIQDPVEAHQKYCSFYQSALESFHLNSKPFLIAHSFGGFVMTQCLAEHPHLFHGAILIAVPGFFSSNGPWGYVCATYFTFGLPQYPIQLLGDWMHYLYDMLSLLTNVQIDYSFVRYWHLVHMSPDMIPDVIVKKFIFHNGLYSMGIGISLLPLIKLTHQHHKQATPQAEPFPVAIVFGEKDFITPPQQGQVISELSGIRSYVIPGANHVAYTHNGGQDFLQIFHEVYSSLDEVHGSYRSPHTSLSLSELSSCLENQFSQWSAYPVVPSYFLSKWLSEEMFRKIRSIVQTCAAAAEVAAADSAAEASLSSSPATAALVDEAPSPFPPHASDSLSAVTEEL